jgi:DNA-binding NtrC family response regulator
MSRVARANDRNLSILSTSALNKLRQYSWPYNVRELESVLQKAMETAPDVVVSENDISFDTMIKDSRSPDGAMGLAGLTMAEIERRAIIETINACGGNRAQSARKLGVSEKTIYNKIKQFKLRGIV